MVQGAKARADPSPPTLQHAHRPWIDRCSSRTSDKRGEVTSSSTKAVIKGEWPNDIVSPPQEIEADCQRALCPEIADEVESVTSTA